MSAVMSIRSKRVIGGAAVLIFAVHWLFIVISLSPENALKASTRSVIETYVGTFFFQRWRLFAPDPGTFSKKLFYRCRDERDDWTEWKNSGDDLLEQHYRYRITHHGKLLRVQLGLVIGIAQEMKILEQTMPCAKDDTACLERRTAALHRRPVYVVAKRFAWDTCNADLTGSGARLTGAQFRIQLANTKPFAERADPSPASVSNFDFDPFRLDAEER